MRISATLQHADSSLEIGIFVHKTEAGNNGISRPTIMATTPHLPYQGPPCGPVALPLQPSSRTTMPMPGPLQHERSYAEMRILVHKTRARQRWHSRPTTMVPTPDLP